MTNDNKDLSFTVWQSIEVLTGAILNIQKELSLIKDIVSGQKITLEKGAELLPNNPNSGLESNRKARKIVSVQTMAST